MMWAVAAAHSLLVVGRERILHKKQQNSSGTNFPYTFRIPQQKRP